MDAPSDDRKRPSAPRIEVYAGVGRKRWPDELKLQIVAESFEPGVVVADVARRHGCRPQQVHDWRRQARLGQLVLPASAKTDAFVPLVAEACASTAAEVSKATAIIIEIFNARVEIRGAPELAVLSDVFTALRRARSC